MKFLDNIINYFYNKNSISIDKDLALAIQENPKNNPSLIIEHELKFRYFIGNVYFLLTFIFFVSVIVLSNVVPPGQLASNCVIFIISSLCFIYNYIIIWFCRKMNYKKSYILNITTAIFLFSTILSIFRIFI